MESIVAESVAPRQLSMMLVTCFAGLALALASIGLSGAVSHSVVRRRHELGIRMALGAARRDVLRLVLSRGASLTLVGLAVGMVASLAATPLLTGMLFGVTFLDPLTYLAVAAVVLATAVAAVYLKARAAAKIDPLEALRYE
ncbi:MAG: FtsX-like permease family protein [Bryobacteraceae bacterium]